MATPKPNLQLHVVFFPLLAHGHMIPLFDIARLFAAHGAKATFFTTALNAPVFSANPPLTVHLHILNFPSQEVGLPSGLENIEDVPVGNNVVFDKFLRGVELLRSQLESALPGLQPKPSCMVSDMFLPWTADVAADMGIPRLVFHGSGFFAMSVNEVLSRKWGAGGVEVEEDEEFVVPELPGSEVIRMRGREIWWEMKRGMKEEEKSELKRVMERGMEAERRSYGVIMNSFYELEAEYGDHYQRAVGIRAWCVGPISLCNTNRPVGRSYKEKATRGKKTSIDENECMKWLDSKPPNSVIYICFGSIIRMSSNQLHEIAVALEASDQYFIWVVRARPSNNEEDAWLPSGFEERIQGKGLIIRGWAPQVMILDHKAIGGFMTHCGWNSILEGISTGVSMVTWPGIADQFMNEKLITQVLRIGVPVGARQYLDVGMGEASVKRKAIEEAVRRVMDGKEAEEMRSKAVKLKVMAWEAVKVGGSSYKGLRDLLKELNSLQG